MGILQWDPDLARSGKRMAKMFISFDPNSAAIFVQMRAEDDGIVGDLHDVVEPGGGFGKLTYDDLRKLGPGAHDVDN